MTLYRTSDMEFAARTLAKQYDKVIVRMDYRLPRIIRFRPQCIADLNYHMIANDRRREGEFSAWEQAGGVLLYRRKQHPIRDNERLPWHQGQLIVECPMTLDTLDFWTRGSETAVVYQPPTWDIHREKLALMLAPRRTWAKSYKFRLPPEDPALLPTWHWLQGSTDLRPANHRQATRMLNRRGHIEIIRERTGEKPSNASPTAAADLDEVIRTVERAPDLARTQLSVRGSA